MARLIGCSGTAYIAVVLGGLESQNAGGIYKTLRVKLQTTEADTDRVYGNYRQYRCYRHCEFNGRTQQNKQEFRERFFFLEIKDDDEASDDVF